MPRLSTSLNSSARYRPYYPLITTRSVFPPERLIASEVTVHRAFGREEDPKQIKVPQPRVVTSTPETNVVAQPKLDFLLAEEIEIFPRPGGEAGRDFNLEKTLNWQDYERFNKELGDLTNQYLDTNRPLSSQDPIRVKQVHNAMYALYPRLRRYCDDWAFKCCLQRVLKLGKTRQKAMSKDQQEAADSELSEEEDDEQPKKSTAKKTIPATKKRSAVKSQGKMDGGVAKVTGASKKPETKGAVQGD